MVRLVVFYLMLDNLKVELLNLTEKVSLLDDLFTILGLVKQ